VKSSVAAARAVTVVGDSGHRAIRVSADMRAGRLHARDTRHHLRLRVLPRGVRTRESDEQKGSGRSQDIPLCSLLSVSRVCTCQIHRIPWCKVLSVPRVCTWV
jgi:hypothetical protein